MMVAEVRAMAKIMLDVYEFPDRSRDVFAWLKAGDRVVLTVRGKPTFRLSLAKDASEPSGDLPPRVLGMHPGAMVMAPDFNDPLPEDWSDGPE
jgi:hypothetical protein